jgi:hypothetical protein
MAFRAQKARSTVFGILLALGAAPAAAQAPAPRCLRYAFQPDCFEAPCPAAQRRLGNRLDLPPQVAVWVESADRSRFIDTLMVTNLTAKYGLGNRPGLWNHPSGPKHPYGKRLMALPVWAWARGSLYDPVVMQDGHEEWLGFHESISSPDPYYCRPMGLTEIDVDAVSCPTKVFNSAKGRLAAEMAKIPYPPRNDLLGLSSRDCDNPSAVGSCAKSAERYAAINDLDAVAAATPRFDRVYEGLWTLPASLPAEGEYALFVEVNREFDQNQSHTYPAYEDKMLRQTGFTQLGLGNNIGQPSVVFRVPFRLAEGSETFGFADAIAGYGDWNGATGTLHAPDATIGKGRGSGEGRLRTVVTPWSDAPAAMGKVFIRLEPCADGGPGGCDPLPPAPAPVTDMLVIKTGPTTAEVTFRHTGDQGRPVQSYDIRRRLGDAISEENFLEGVPVAHVDPSEPGSNTKFVIDSLKPLTSYVVGVRARGRCGSQSPLVQVPFTTTDLQFKMLTGCFIATAAYGSALAPAVTALRRLRDRTTAGSALGTAAADLYERSSPPLAAVLADSEAGRALVRAVLAPALELVRAAAAAPLPR